MTWVRQIMGMLLALVVIVGGGESLRAEVAMLDTSAMVVMAGDEGAGDCGGCSGGDVAPAECTAVGCSGCGAGLALLPAHSGQVPGPVAIRAHAAGRLPSGLSPTPHLDPPENPVLS